jgi:hypothetical protein
VINTHNGHQIRVFQLFLPLDRCFPKDYNLLQKKNICCKKKYDCCKKIFAAKKNIFAAVENLLQKKMFLLQKKIKFAAR